MYMHFIILNTVKLAAKSTIQCIIDISHFISRIITSDWPRQVTCIFYT